MTIIKMYKDFNRKIEEKNKVYQILMDKDSKMEKEISDLVSSSYYRRTNSNSTRKAITPENSLTT